MLPQDRKTNERYNKKSGLTANRLNRLVPHHHFFYRVIPSMNTSKQTSLKVAFRYINACKWKWFTKITWLGLIASNYLP